MVASHLHGRFGGRFFCTSTISFTSCSERMAARGAEVSGGGIGKADHIEGLTPSRFPVQHSPGIGASRGPTVRVSSSLFLRLCMFCSLRLFQRSMLWVAVSASQKSSFLLATFCVLPGVHDDKWSCLHGTSCKSPAVLGGRWPCLPEGARFDVVRCFAGCFRRSCMVLKCGGQYPPE